MPEPERTTVGADPAFGLRLVGFTLLLGLIAVCVKAATAPVANPDVFFHIRFGQEFLHGWSIWHPGSVTRFGTRPWVPTQWLGQVLLGWFDEQFGLPGVAWLGGLVLVSFVVTLFVVCRRHTGTLPAAALTTIVVLASAGGLSARPQVYSYALVVVVVGAWLRTREDGRPRWWLVALAWVWPLLHGMWVLGLVVSVVAAVGVVLERRELTPRVRIRLLLVPVAMAVAAAVTPIGPRIYGAVLFVGSHGSIYTEWGPPNFHQISPALLALLLAALVVVVVRRGVRDWFVLAMLLLACAFAVYSDRTVPISAGIAAPLLAFVLPSQIANPQGYRRDGQLAVALGVVAVIAIAVVAPHTAKHGPRYPAWVDTELDGLPRGTGLLAEDSTGGVLTWRDPQVSVLVHGYGDTFTDAEIERNLTISHVEPGWQQALAATGITRALLRDRTPLLSALESEPGWRVVHHSGGYAWLEVQRGGS